MAAWDLVCTWRRLLVFLARGLCACSLALLYLLISLALCHGGRTARTAQPSHLQEPLVKGSTGPSPSSTAEEKSSVSAETTLVGFDTPLNTHHHSRFYGGQPLIPKTQEGVCPLVIPKIVVQDFSAEDGLIRYKAPEYDLMDSLKGRRRSSRARAFMTLEDRLAFATRPPPFRSPPALGAPSVGGLKPLYLADNLKHRPSDALVQNIVGFPGRKRTFGDVVAKDGSFVIVGL